MDTKSLLIFAVVGLFIYFFFLRGGSGDPLPQDFKDNASKLIQSEEVVGIDVRSLGEVHSNPAKGSKHIPVDQLENQAKNLDRNKHYLLFCESGMRASVAVKKMKQMGFQKVSNIKDWRSWNKIKK